jgi:RHS repeat-associated protein
MPTTTFRTVNGRILGHNKAGVASEYLLDPLGSVIGTSTSAGVVSNRTTYWPYGEVRTGGVSSVTPFGFCGGWGYYTDSSGSLYVRARYYRPSLTRWQTVDPLWPGESAYGYVLNNPVTMIDYSGQKPSNGRVGKCAIYLCKQYGWGLGKPATHVYLCVTGPNGGCAGGLYPDDRGKDNPIGGPGRVRDDEKSCESHAANDPNGPGFAVHCEEASNRVPEDVRCELAAAMCECLRKMRKNPPRYSDVFNVCYSFPRKVANCVGQGDYPTRIKNEALGLINFGRL